MLDLEPLQHSPEAPSLRRAWTGVITSACLHLALIALVLWVERPKKFQLTHPRDSLELADRAKPHVNAIFLTPPRRVPPPPSVHPGPDQPHPVTPPTPPIPTPPPPPPPSPDKTRDAASMPDQTPPTEPLPAVPAPVPPTPPHRIPSIAYHPGEFASPIDPPRTPPIWKAPPDLGTIGAKCVPGPPHVRGPNDPIRYGVVAGRVYRQGTTEPLAGAELSVMGTNYHATSDANGDYVLRFDDDLLSNCQVQNVLIQADGFLSQMLILTTGPATRNDVNLRAHQ